VNKELTARQTTVIVSIFLLLLGLFSWAYRQSINIEQVSYLQPADDGSVWLRTGLLFSQFNPRGELLAEYDLAELGVAASYGDFLLLPGQQLLLLAEQPSLHWLQCDLPLQVCQPFTPTLPLPNHSFHLAFDEQNLRVLLSDVSAHVVHQLDLASGALKTSSGFRYPNKWRVVNGNAYLVDTNRHHIKHFADSTLQQQLASYEIDLGAYRWPYHFAQVGEQWWVVVMNNAMSDGKVARYSSDWQWLGWLPLPEQVGALAIETLAEQVLISDPDHNRVYRFDISGQPLADLAEGEMAQRLAQSRQQQHDYQRLVYLLASVFVLLLAVGFFVAIKRGDLKTLSAKQLGAWRQQPTQAMIEPPNPNGVYWLQKNTAVIRLYKWLNMVLLLLMPMASAALLYEKITSERIFLLAVVGLITVAMTVFMRSIWKLFQQVAIGVEGDCVVLRDHRGKIVKGSGAAILLSNHAIAIDDVWVPIGGQSGVSIFSRDELSRWLAPRCTQAQNLNEWQALMIQWRARQPVLFGSLLLVAFMLLAVVALEMF
jgi:hypothetical protein